ncbi:putative cytochrome P450 [Halenospora varia]|nr:putative cytochrome P450 [Halenospora varia]
MTSQVYSNVLLLLPALAICYAGCTIIYRLYIHPLAKVPGPKLAALTQGYEMYFDLIQPARFPWQLRKLHERYGLIVRIAPNEVHINDLAYLSTQFSSSPSLKLNKYAPHQHQFGMPESTFNTIDSDLHKLRRSALNPFFSRRSITVLEPMLVEKVNKACSRLQESKDAGTPIDLRLLFSCMTTDILTDYAFPHCFDLLSDPDLAPDWRNSFHTGLRNFQWLKHFPWLWSLLRGTPESLLLKLTPQIAMTKEFERKNQKLVKDIIDEYDPMVDDNKSHPTIFHELLSIDLPAHEKSYERLWQDGNALIGAGVETTSNTLNVAFYHLLTSPEKLERLKKELEQNMPDPSQLLRWAQLEKLPYLTAVIKESLRVGLGTTSRFIRVAPNSTLRYKNHVFLPGTAISMSPLLLSEHSDIYDNSNLFLPECWLEKNSSADLLVFGRGPRMCAGQNLAYAELYLTLAAIVRRFHLELFETDFSDIEAVFDAVMPLPKADTEGVRVLVS